MKKLVYLLSLVLSFAFVSTASATVTSSSSGYNTPQIVDYLNFTAEMQSDGSVLTKWNHYNGDYGSLNYYKVSRSQTNNSPVYPDDGYIYAGSSDTYTDKSAPLGKNYYRVCAITSTKNRICSNVVTLTIEEVEEVCIQVVTYAKKDDECKAYPTPCAVPDGWTEVNSCASAPYGELILTVKSEEEKPYLQWYFENEGAAPYGYKIAISTQNKLPTYPVMSGDTYQYLAHESATTYHHKNATGGKTYYYRVCLYNNGECLNYSNAVSIVVDENEDDTTTDEDSIYGELDLSVILKEGKPYLKWDFEGEGNAPKGYKIAISTTHQNPTYPVMSGDTYKYLSSENAKSYYDKYAKNGKNYYYRVCLYLGGKCGNYSNAVSIKVPEGTNTETSTTKPKTSFSDVKSGIWFESYLNDFVNRGIIEGYNDGTFQPSRTVNRAEMAKMVVKALNIKIESNDLEIFCDVSNDAWYQAYVMQLYFDSIIEGYIGGSCDGQRLFRPAQEVTRAEAIKIILTMFGASVEPLSSGDQTGFTDVNNSHWAASYIRTAFSLGIVNGYDDGTFQPDAKLTRAEFVKMLSEAEEVLD